MTDIDEVEMHVHVCALNLRRWRSNPRGEFFACGLQLLLLRLHESGNYDRRVQAMRCPAVAINWIHFVDPLLIPFSFQE